jgi:hypothetical protein
MEENEKMADIIAAMEQGLIAPVEEASEWAEPLLF